MNRILRYTLALILASTGCALADPLVVTGITEPFMDVTMSSPVQGTVFKRLFQEGDKVKDSDVILELDSKLEQLEAQRRLEVYKRASADYEATRKLFNGSKAVSKDEFEKRRMEYNVAEAEYGIAEEQLKRRKIIAPFAGSIVEYYLQPGAGCEPYQPLVRLVDTSRCYFIGYVEGTSSLSLKLGQTVKIEVAGTKDATKGTISFIAPVVDSASGLAKVKAIFDNEDGKMRPGLAAKMILE